MRLNVSMILPRSPLEYNGGIETHVMEVSKRLASLDVNVRILSTSSSCKVPRRYVIDRVNMEIFPAIAPLEMYYFSIPLYNAIRRERSQILHVHGYQDFSTLASILGKKKQQKLFATVHSGCPAMWLTSFVNRYYRFAIGRLMRKADKIIGVSNFDLRTLGFIETGVKTIVMPNGVDFDDFTQKHDLPVSVPENTRFVLSVGRLEKYKGHHSVIESFATLKALRPVSDDLKLVIVGSGPYRRKLEELVGRFKLEKDTLILSNLTREEVIGLHQKCQLFILLSRFESCSISVVDALAARKPIIVSSNSALLDFVKKKLAVGIPYPSEADYVAKKMQEVLENPVEFVAMNPELTSWDEIARRLKELYSDALQDEHTAIE